MEENTVPDRIDILNRDPFVNQLFNIVEKLSAKKKSCTFAVNGKWGSGKSFVMDMFEEKIRIQQSEGTDSDKYLLFHYDCWKYDYYEEPLFAIVSAMLDKITSETKFHALENAKKCFSVATRALIKLKGFGLIQNIKEAEQEFDEEHNGTDFDAYFDFKNTLEEVQKAFQDLAKGRTLVVVVDELDRCLPTYTIKVLERLHHVFEGVENCIVILAVDKKQIEHTIRNIYGAECDTDAYLRKFIDFEIGLGNGKTQENITEKYKDYISMFDEFALRCRQPISFLLIAILDSIDPRSRNKIVAKAKLLHNLVFPEEEKPNYAVMCAELFFLTLHFHNPCYSRRTSIYFKYENTFSSLDISEKTKNLFMYYRTHYTEIDNPEHLLEAQCSFDPSLKEVLPYFVYYWLNMYDDIYTKFTNIGMLLAESQDELNHDIYYLKYFAQLADLIK